MEYFYFLFDLIMCENVSSEGLRHPWDLDRLAFGDEYLSLVNKGGLWEPVPIIDDFHPCLCPEGDGKWATLRLSERVSNVSISDQVLVNLWHC